MQLNKNQVVEVNLRDLFFHLLYRWRSILIAALIAALALCGYQYLSVKKTHDAGKLTKDERQYQIDLQNYNDDLETSQNTVRINTKLLQSQNAYRKESIYFQLDPQGVWTATNKYLVKVDPSVLEKLPQGSTIDPADSILSVYTAPLSEATDEELTEAFGTDKPEYIGELVVTGINTNENTVTVTVKASTKEAAQAGMKLLNTKIEAIASGKAQEIDAHKLSLITEEVSLKSDDELAKKQEDLAKSITENQEALQEARQQLDRLEDAGEPKAPGMHLVKMAVIGFILGAALLAFAYAVSYVLKGRLNNTRELTERYNLPLFGEFATAGLLHSGKGLDKALSKWEHGKKAVDSETVYDNIAALIAEKQEAKQIQIVSTLPSEKLKDLKEALTKRLPDKSITVQADMLRNSKAIAEASKADAVILAEEKGVSTLKDMDRMAENLIISEAKVIGAIIL